MFCSVYIEHVDILKDVMLLPQHTVLQCVGEATSSSM